MDAKIIQNRKARFADRKDLRAFDAGKVDLKAVHRKTMTGDHDNRKRIDKNEGRDERRIVRHDKGNAARIADCLGLETAPLGRINENYDVQINKMRFQKHEVMDEKRFVRHAAGWAAFPPREAVPERRNDDFSNGNRNKKYYQVRQEKIIENREIEYKKIVNGRVVEKIIKKDEVKKEKIIVNGKVVK